VSVMTRSATAIRMATPLSSDCLSMPGLDRCISRDNSRRPAAAARARPTLLALMACLYMTPLFVRFAFVIGTSLQLDIPTLRVT
jgi:hypothetical protein